MIGICCVQAYAFPKFHFDLHLCKSNRPPHTAVRGPGEIQATMLAEHLIEHVAARLHMDPMLVRERNFIKHDGMRSRLHAHTFLRPKGIYRPEAGCSMLL